MKSLIGQKIAILAANGFDEADMIAAQRALVAAGATMRLVSSDNGLVNGWDGKGWGHNFPVDAALNTALGVDYDGLVIVGGQRSFDKLKMTAHTKRFIGSFMLAQKPVVAFGEAADVLMEEDQRDVDTVLKGDAGEVAAKMVDHLMPSDTMDKVAA
jgi:protease I